jgi:hypothetical protein
MRMTLPLSLLPFAVACSSPQPSLPVDRIELTQSNVWSSVTITVNRQGAGSYELRSESRKKAGTFQIAPERFRRLQESLEPFRRESVPDSPKRAIAFLTTPSCPNRPFTNDAGLVWVRWFSPSANQLYFADLGCDAGRNARRNANLLQKVSSFPVPRD